jgi:tRNA(Ile)-lysidine synthase
MQQESLEQRVLRYIKEHRLVSKQPLVVAVSGGQDSVCLLYVLARLQKELALKLHIAHLNHQLRGEESDADARYVSELARKLNLPATIEKRNVKAYRARHRLSLEEAAREVRYTFLAQVAKSIGADRAAVGHTADDHIETILMHLIRGTGTRGLRGLQSSSRWQSKSESLIVVRPLLEVSRQETAEYCRRHKLQPRIDVTNLSLSPLRNRIRLQLLPLLESYNPKVCEALLRTGRIAADDIAFLDRETARIWDKIAQQQDNVVILDKAKFLKLPSTLKRYILLASIEKIVGSIMDIEMHHIEEIMDALTKPAGKSLNLPRGLIFAIEYDKYLISPEPGVLVPLPVLKGEFQLNVHGETAIPGWRIEATILKGKYEGAKPLQNLNFSLSSQGEGDKVSEVGQFYTACLDFDKTGSNITIRSRLTADRFQPLGMSETKKLGEFMIDAKIPRAWRQRVPIVCSPRQILWVVGYRIDDRVKVTDTTQRVLCLTIARQ